MTVRQPAHDEFLDYIIEKVTPAEMLAFQPSAKALARAEILLDRSSEDVLTLDERTELDQMLRADRLVSILKARAVAAFHKP